MPVSDFALLAALLHVVIVVPVCIHIILTKQDTVAISWIGLVVVSPVVGALLYWIFGINRVARRARRYRGRRRIPTLPNLETHAMPFKGLPTSQQRQLFQFARSVHETPFLGGNTVKPLVNTDGAVPDMLEAIAGAQNCIALSVYTFEVDDVGTRFIDALTQAHRRGVQVRVLMDEIGTGRSVRSADKILSAAGIATARFIPRKLRFLPLINLRNHRKIMIVDGRIGYIGGMNICRSYAAHKGGEVRDLHFRVMGPVISQLNAIFEEDWRFAADERVELPPCAVDPENVHEPVYARVVPDGPDESAERTQWIILGVLAVAQKTVHILTPYFVPNEILSNALWVCAMRGVSVQVVVPARTDHAVVDWAMEAKFQYLIERGVKIYRGPAPFDHSKLMVVDGVWSLVGSTNWDQRSLRLNFEANLECYDGDLGQKLDTHFDNMKKIARLVALDDLVNQSFGRRLRNNVARLFAPYL